MFGLPAVALQRLGPLDLDGAAGREILSVQTSAAMAEGLPQVLGTRRVEGGVLRFTPRFPFRAGLGYRARFDGAAFDRLTGLGDGTTPAVELRFAPSPASVPAVRVEAVYPSAEILPENLLRLYVWFSAPMRRRGVAEGIRLVDVEAGTPVELPFVEIADGLWDPSGRRLTLFFHPGRIKRGVGPRLALGPPLRQGRRYRLEIDAALPDARGRPLAAGHAKSFVVGRPDRRSPEPKTWSLSAPAGEREPLVVDFPEPLDHGLLLRLLRVIDATGRPVAGATEISRSETRWSFRPQTPWRPGGYRLRVASALEDLAGNSLARLFDEATATGRKPGPPAAAWGELDFEATAPR